jgi:orotidine-5'-phosphate decarboxylase
LHSKFGKLLLESFEARGQLCVGIDPHASLLQSWGLPDSASGVREFSLRVIEAASTRVGVIKPQVSFFERFGAAGFQVLAEVTNQAKAAGLLVIADAKRGDIGTTMDAYLEAWFGESSGLYADALTVSPYLGLGSISSGFEKWSNSGKGIFSLVATSNPEGETVQLASLGGKSLAVSQLQQLANLNGFADSLGSYGAVIGATLDFDRFGISLVPSNVPILAPGFGAQGAELSQAKRIFAGLSGQVCFSVSRSVLIAGKDGIGSAIDSANSELRSGLAG